MTEVTEIEPEEKPPKKRRARVLIWLLLGFLFFLVLFQSVFLLYSDQIFGRVIKEVVYQGSNKVYVLSYDKVVFNVFRNEMAFENFRLTADSNLFKSNLKPGTSNRIFEATCPSLSLKGPSIVKLYFDDVLGINELIIEQPKVEMRVYGELRTGQAGFRNFHEVLSNYIGFLRIDNFQLRDAEITVTAINERGRRKYEFKGLNTAITDFTLNRYSKSDSLMHLGNLSLSLDENEYPIDSTSNICFKTLVFDAKDSTLVLSGFSIKRKVADPVNNMPALDLNTVEVFGLDPGAAYFNNNLEARLIRADSGRIDYDLVKRPDSVASWNKIENLFDTIDIGLVSLANTTLDYHKRIGKKQPHVIVPIRRADLHFLLLDSQSFFGNKINLYSKDLELTLDPFDIYSKDSVSQLRTESLVLSTRRREILLFNVELSTNKGTEKGTIDGAIGSIQMFGVDPMLVVQKNEIIGRAVLIDQPNLVLRSGKEPKSISPQVLNDLVRKQFKKVHLSHIEFEGGNLVLKKYNGATKGTLKGVKAYGNNFMAHKGAVNSKREFLCDWFNADVPEAAMHLEDGLHVVESRNLKAFSQKGGLFAERIQVKLKSSVTDSIAKINDVIREADFHNVSVEGLDVGKLRDQSIIQAHYVEARGYNKLKIELNSPNKGSSTIRSVALGELDVDSCDFSISTLHQGSTGFKCDRIKFQVCDFKWDKDYARGEFDLYSIQLEGQDVKASTAQLGHVLTASKLKVNSSYNLFQFNGLDYRPINDRFSGKNALWFNASQFRLSGFDLPLFFKTRKIAADNFYCLKPGFTMHTLQDSSDGLSGFLKLPFERVGHIFPSIAVGQLRIQQGKLNYTNHGEVKDVTYKAGEVNAFITDFAIDSFTTQTDSNILFSQTSEIKIKGFEQKATDTSMILSIGAMELMPHQHSVTLDGFEIRNRKEPTKLGYLSVTGEKTKIHDFDYNDFLVNKRIHARKIELLGTQLTLGATEKAGNNKAFFKKKLPEALTKQYKSIYADSLVFNDAVLNIRSKNDQGEIRSEKLSGWNVLMRVFRVDRNYDQLNFLYARAINAQLPYYTKRLKDSLNIFQCKSLNVDVNRGHIYLDSTVLSPRYEKMLYGKTHGTQIDRIAVYNMNSRIVNFDFEKWLYQGVYEADYAYINRTEINVFRDKSLPESRGEFREMPQRLLRQLPIKLKLDTTFINSWSITYEEKLSGNVEPGLIQFTDFDGKITGITNYDSLVQDGVIGVEVNTRLMDKGKVNANLNIPLQHENDSFSFSGKVDNMDMREINPLLENLARISITSGTADWMKFEGNADRYLATGEVELRYGNLHVAVLDSAGENRGFVQKAMTFLANNFIIRSGNRLFPKSGTIYYERDGEKSVFNYGAKALLSGIKESIGIKNR